MTSRTSLVVDTRSLTIRLVTDPTELAGALELERTVFVDCNFVSMDHYEKYLAQSVFFGAFDSKDECVGVVRLVERGEHLPPFIANGHLDGRETWEEAFKQGELIEFATMAVQREWRNGPVFLGLVRAAYRYAHNRGARWFGAMMDPRRAEHQNRAFQLCYRQAGPLQFYMEEAEVNAPYILGFEEWDSRTSAENPEYFNWMLLDEPTEWLRRPPLSSHLQRSRHHSGEVIDVRDPQTSA